MRRSQCAPIHGRARTLWCSLTVGGAAVTCVLAAAALLAGSVPHRATSVGLMVIDTPAPPEPVAHSDRADHHTAAPAHVEATPRQTTADAPSAAPRQAPARAESQTASQRTASTAASASTDEVHVTFDGRQLKPVDKMAMTVTAYSPDARSCGEWADGVTASGYSVWTNGMKLVAADTDLLPFGTIVTIPGYNDGKPVQVLDRGGAIKGHRLDLLYPSHESALQWGRKDLEITVWQYADAG